MQQYKLNSSWYFDKTEGTHWFVCAEVLLPSQPYGVMLSTVSLPNHTFTG